MFVSCSQLMTSGSSHNPAALVFMIYSFSSQHRSHVLQLPSSPNSVLPAPLNYISSDATTESITVVPVACWVNTIAIVSYNHFSVMIPRSSRPTCWRLKVFTSLLSPPGSFKMSVSLLVLSLQTEKVPQCTLMCSNIPTFSEIISIGLAGFSRLDDINTFIIYYCLIWMSTKLTFK